MLAAGLSGATAEMVSLKPVADTCIAEYYPEKNFGGMQFFTAGTTQNYTTNRGLIKFNLSSAIPAGSKVISVSLTTEVTGDPDEPWNSANFGLHRLVRDWGEGDNFSSLPRTAASAGTNEVNWTHRFALTSETWSVPGGQSGVDYVAAPSTTTFVYQAGDSYNFGSSAALVADAQLWLDHPGTNFGWMLIVQNESEAFTARRFGSRETLYDFARLDVEFQPPPPITGFSAANGMVLLQFLSTANFAHQLQFTTNLTSGTWLSYPPIGPFTNPTTVHFGTPMFGPQGYYRLKVY